MKKLILSFFVSVEFFNAVLCQNIGINEPNPDNSAILEMTSTERGLLIPRMTTGERDIIPSPANSLLIFNTSTQCFEAWNQPSTSWVAFGCIGCTVPTAVTASAAPNPICVGSTLTLTGSATDATSWSWTGPDSYTSASQSPTIAGITIAGAGVYILAAGNNCGWATGANTASVTVNAPPTTATNGSTQTICTTGNATLSGNNPSVGTGAWTVTSGPSTSSSQFANTSVYNTTFTPAGGAGSYVVRWTISNSPCTSSYADATITVNEPPTTADAGSDINPACDATTATLAGNDPTVGTGLWTVESGTATITDNTLYNSGVTGLAVPGTATLRWTISNPPCSDSYDDVVITTSVCGPPPCTWNGLSSFSITHTAGTVAPVTKSVTYNQTQTSLSGSSKCWITQNLGSDQQATSATDATELSAGWYWQFNKKQGFKHDGTTRTPSTAWITPIVEGSEWVAAQDPCTIELGTGWRIPTYTELVNVDATGGWSNYNHTYASVLKLHAGGNLIGATGVLEQRGAIGSCWSNHQSDANGSWRLGFSSAYSGVYNTLKDVGFNLRCIRD